MKKAIGLLVLVVVAFFALKKWSPGTLDKLTGIHPPDQTETAPADLHQALPSPEPAPIAKTAEPTSRQPAVAAVQVDKTAQVVVFCYHRVEGPSGGALSITPELFEHQMQRLRDTNIKVISMQDFLAWRRNEKSIPSKSAIITIDDGYVSSFDVARPILKKFGYPWTCFIYTKFIGSGGKSLTWEQLATLRDEGVEIGCHSVSHLNLRDTRPKAPQTYEAWLKDEIIGSKKLIEQKLAIKCEVFAYPEGKFGAKVLDVIKEAGYAAAFSVYGQRVTHGAPGDRIGRYAWYSRRPQDMEQALKFEGPLSSNEAELPDTSIAQMETQPRNGEVIPDSEPVLKADLSTLGTIDDGSLALRLSGTGPVPFKFSPETTFIEAKVPQPLKPGNYSVILTAKANGKPIERQWTFRVDPASASNPTAETVPAGTPRK